MGYKIPDVAIEARRSQVAALMQRLARPTCRRIADALARLDPPIHVGRQTVSRDMRAIKEAWQQQRHTDVDAWVARELEKIQMVEQEAWAALAASKGTVLTRVDTLARPRDENGMPVMGAGQVVVGSTETRKEQNADPRYMGVILKCSEQRARLLGLNRDSLDVTSGGLPVKVTLNIGDNTPVDKLPGPLGIVPTGD